MILFFDETGLSMGKGSEHNPGIDWDSGTWSSPIFDLLSDKIRFGTLLSLSIF